MLDDILRIKRQQKAQEKLDELELQQRNSDVKKVFDTPEGLRVLNAILAMGEIYATTFTGDEHSYFFEGRRSLCLEILDMVIEADREIYIKILRGDMNG
jgi:hypothetical protein